MIYYRNKGTSEQAVDIAETLKHMNVDEEVSVPRAGITEGNARTTASTYGKYSDRKYSVFMTDDTITFKRYR